MRISCRVAFKEHICVMTLRPFCDCIYLERIDAKPDAGLLTYLLPDVINRAERFLSPKRQSDFLWTRLLLVALAKVRGLAVQFRENPPYSPIVLSDSPFYSTISHTATFVGAALATAPVAIDLEVLRADRPLEAIAERCFGPDFLSYFPPEEKVTAFYKAWGVHECAVKLNGKFVVDGSDVRIRMPNNRSARIVHAPIVHAPIGKKTLFTQALAADFRPGDPILVTREILAQMLAS